MMEQLLQQKDGPERTAAEMDKARLNLLHDQINNDQILTALDTDKNELLALTTDESAKDQIEGIFEKAKSEIGGLEETDPQILNQKIEERLSLLEKELSEKNLSPATGMFETQMRTIKEKLGASVPTTPEEAEKFVNENPTMAKFYSYVIDLLNGLLQTFGMEKMFSEFSDAVWRSNTIPIIQKSLKQKGIYVFLENNQSNPPLSKTGSYDALKEMRKDCRDRYEGKEDSETFEKYWDEIFLQKKGVQEKIKSLMDPKKMTYQELWEAYSAEETPPAPAEPAQATATPAVPAEAPAVATATPAVPAEAPAVATATPAVPAEAAPKAPMEAPARANP